MKQATAFAPAHVSGLFAVHDDADDPLQRGSRGAGWCLDKGAHATVRTADALEITLNGHPGSASVTRAALEMLDLPQPVAVDIRLELPTGQGFGMSAAGTLAACLAACHLFDLEPERALEATHTQEVLQGTGLGDAVGSWFGCGEVRVKPGCPPHGWAMRIEAPAEKGFLFCTMGDAIETASIIGEPEWKQATRTLGDEAVDRIMDHGREGAWQKLLIESAVFSHRIGLMSKEMAKLGSRLPEGLSWGQCMLGNTLWVYGTDGDLERCEALLEGCGALVRAGVDGNGARMTRRFA